MQVKEDWIYAYHIILTDTKLQQYNLFVFS